MLNEKIKFEEKYISTPNDPKSSTLRMFFTAPLALLPWKHEGAVMAAILIETPASDVSCDNAIVCMSPTIEEEKGCFTDCDWKEVTCFSDEEISNLIKMALE